MTSRIAICLEYDGTFYFGWQRQDGLVTLQQTVETALSQVADHPVTVVCAGRTDAGVHAFGQVIHFDSDAPRSLDNWLRGGNAYLQDSITLRFVQPVEADFHARYAALSRSYRYVIYNHPVRSSVFRHKATWWYRPLDVDRMQAAAHHWLGKHDFSAFRSVNCQAKTAMRTLHAITLERYADFIVIELTANAFLHHMVRNMVGVLLPIGEGLKPIHWAREVLLARDRTLAGITAPPDGLYLVGVEYPPRFGLPTRWSAANAFPHKQA